MQWIKTRDLYVYCCISSYLILVSTSTPNDTQIRTKQTFAECEMYAIVRSYVFHLTSARNPNGCVILKFDFI